MRKKTSSQPRTAAAFRAEALTRLREMVAEGEPWEPESEPQVSEILKSAEGGFKTVLTALRMHDDKDAKKFLCIYDSLTTNDKKYLKLEEIAHVAGIGSVRLVEIAQAAIILHGQVKTNLQVWSAAPGIVKKSLDNAKTTKGLADREWALKRIGYIPLPKGTQITVPVQINNAPPQVAATVTPAAVYIPAGDRLRMIHAAVEGQRKLPAPAETGDDTPTFDTLHRDTADILSGEYVSEGEGR